MTVTTPPTPKTSTTPPTPPTPPTPEQSNVPVRSDRGDGHRLARWDPVELVQELQDDMARWWGQGWPFRPGWLERPFRRPLAALQAWTPRIDVYEKGDRLIIKAELPGIKKEDIQVSLEQDGLVIRGERKTESEVREEDYHRCECTYGSFFRRLPLPFQPKTEQIEASFSDGVLEIRIPKPAAEQGTTQHIPIS